MIKESFDSYTRIPRGARSKGIFPICFLLDGSSRIIGRGTATMSTGGKVIEESAWTRVAQREGNVFSFDKGLQVFNPDFGHPLIVDGEGGLKVDEVSEHLGGNCASGHHPGYTEVPELGVHRFIEA